MTGLVIYSKADLQKIRPYLPEFFNHQKYITCKEFEPLFNAGKQRLKKLLEVCSENKVDTILFATHNNFLRYLAHRLRSVSSMGIKTYFIPYYSYSTITSPEKLQSSVLEFDINKPRLNYLEFHVVDHCNLNCKGCTHYCNLESTPKFSDYNQWKNDMNQLKHLFWGIEIIRIMGGEPLLNPELPKYVRETRALFPDADVRITTNGLLIPKISDELVLAMKDTETRFDISLYIPTMKLLDRIRSKLDSDGIKYKISSPITHFERQLTINPINNEREAFNHCNSWQCNTISNGMIWTCPIIFRAPLINNKYRQHFPSDPMAQLSEVDDAWNLYDKLNNPHPYCKYCTPYHDRFEWEQKKGNNADISDWVVEEKELDLLKQNYLKHH